MYRIAALTLLFAGQAAASPVHIPWAGRVFDADGVPVTGPADVTVTLRPDATTTSTPLWTDTFTDVPIEHGYVQVLLGTAAVLDLTAFPADTAYVQVQINGLTIMGPARLNAVPYAVRAQAIELSENATCDADHAGRMGTTPEGGIRLCAGADGWLNLDVSP